MDINNFDIKLTLTLTSNTNSDYGGRLTGIQSDGGLYAHNHAMEASSKNPLECTCNQRHTQSPAVLPTPVVASSATSTRHVCNSHQNVKETLFVTSRMTCTFKNPPNRKESLHFCRCLHRRRASLKRWSRRHREVLHSRTTPLNSECPKDPLTLKSQSACVIPRLGELVITEGLDCEIIQCDKLLTSYKNSGEAISFERERLSLDDPLPPLHDAPDVDDVILRGTGIARDFVAPLRKVVDIFGALMAGVASAADRLCVGLVRARRRHWTDGVPGDLGWTQFATPMTFHRWIVLLLICIMVLPPPTSAAPGGLPWQNGEEIAAEPGYKYSWYEALPPKAMYESVIICLLAVSAFIGLIVWVLKSNFEERQQKRMRREASLRERTSSLGFIKT